MDHRGAGVIREDFSEEVTLKQAPEQREGVSHRNNGGKDSRQRAQHGAEVGGAGHV